MADRFPQLVPKDLIRALERLGFLIRRTTGSHVILRHPTSKNFAVVPRHNHDLRRGTLFGILKQAGVTTEDLLKFL